jgi:hypothetical protein
MSRNATAKAIRLAKEAHPERYCTLTKCLRRAPCSLHSDVLYVAAEHASREEQHARYIDCGPQAWDDRD